MRTRIAVCAASAALFAACAHAAEQPAHSTSSGQASTGSGQAYPVKPLRLIVPTSPGGGTDFSARTIGPKLSEILGQPVVIENRPGGATIIGTELAARAAPNGYTLLIGASSMASHPHLYAKLPYDVARDFAPISQVVIVPHALVAHPSLPARSVKDLIAFAKARPGQLDFAAGSAGSNPHLAMELFNHTAGIRLTHVPFKGQGPALTNVLGGHTTLMMGNLLSALPQVKNGRLRALGVTSAKRATVAPDIPTIAESGLPRFEVVQWFSMFAPAGTPQDIVEKVHASVVRALQDPGVRERFLNDGADPVGSTPAELAAVIRTELKKWGKVIKDAGIKVEGGA